ncbi:MAG: hypothetical protein ACKVOK_03890, partial [Flavobacteriales bacterium]
MKLLYSFALCLLGCIQLSAQSGAGCGITPAFTYTISGNEVTLVNTTTSVYDDVTILYYNWYFSDGGESTEINPVHTFSDLCNTNTCLVVHADSAGYGVEYCGEITLCEWIDFGFDPLEATLASDYDDVAGEWLLVASASGGVPPYQYSWFVNNLPQGSGVDNWVVEEVTGFGDQVQVCITDGIGCETCASVFLSNMEADCIVELNIVLTDNLLQLSPQVLYEGFEAEIEGGITIDGDTANGFYNGQNFAYYMDAIGNYNVCLELSDWTLEAYPACEQTTCENVEVISLANDCAANFTYTQDDYFFTFLNTSTGFYDSWAWELDGVVLESDLNYLSQLLYPGISTVSITVYNSITLCEDQYTMEFIVPEPAHICGVVFIDENQNGIWDAGEAQAVGMDLSWGGNPIVVQNGVFDQYVYPGTGCLQAGNGDYSMPITTLTSLPVCFANLLELELTPGQEWCSIVLGIYVPLTTVCGQFFFDENGNGQIEPEDVGLAYYELEVIIGYTNNFSVFTDAGGNYCIEYPAGDSSISIVPVYPQNPLAVINPNDFFEYYVGEGLIENINFGVYDTEDELEIAISLAAGGPLSPGFATNYNLLAHNYSNLSTTAQVTLVYLDEQLFVTASDGGVNDDMTNTITWNITIGAYENVELFAAFINATSLIISDVWELTASVTETGPLNELNIANNAATIEQMVVASYDPNNKLVNPIGEGSEGLISPFTNELIYTVNFQNTGTAPAVNIMITDQIDEHLNPETFEMIAASHNVQTSVNGNQIVWLFNNIMLPDSFANEPESHGYVVFRIAPNANLADGATIENTALIYFDFNDAIVTNTTLNTIDYSLQVDDSELQQDFYLYPNPVHDLLMVVTNEEAYFYVHNITGQR